MAAWSDVVEHAERWRRPGPATEEAGHAPVHRHASLVAAVDARDDPQQRGLAGAVGSDQGEDARPPQLEVHVVEGEHRAPPGIAAETAQQLPVQGPSPTPVAGEALGEPLEGDRRRHMKSGMAGLSRWKPEPAQAEHREGGEPDAEGVDRVEPLAAQQHVAPELDDLGQGVGPQDPGGDGVFDHLEG